MNQKKLKLNLNPFFLLLPPIYIYFLNKKHPFQSWLSIETTILFLHTPIQKIHDSDVAYIRKANAGKVSDDNFRSFEKNTTHFCFYIANLRLLYRIYFSFSSFIPLITNRLYITQSFWNSHKLHVIRLFYPALLFFHSVVFQVLFSLLLSLRVHLLAPFFIKLYWVKSWLAWSYSLNLHPVSEFRLLTSGTEITAITVASYDKTFWPINWLQTRTIW